MAVAQTVVDKQLEAVRDYDQWFTRREIRYLPEVLNPGETIYAMTSGLFEGNTWLVVVTDERLLFLDKGMLYGLKQVELPISQISGIAHKTGLMFGTIEVSTSGGSKKVDTITKRDVVKVADVISRLVKRARETPRPRVEMGPSSLDIASQLEKLAALRDKGILTDDEFRAQKAKLLA